MESLLWVGCKMDLQQLLAHAMGFLRANAPHYMHDCTTPSASGGIFSQCVQAAAGGASGAELLCRSCTQLPFGLGFGGGTMFTSVVYDQAERGEAKDKISFTAKLLRDLYHFSQGTRVRVTFDDAGEATIVPHGGEGLSCESIYEFGVVLGPGYSFRCC